MGGFGKVMKGYYNGRQVFRKILTHSLHSSILSTAIEFLSYDR